ncbi:MAG: hypothetical protein L3J10_01030 [Sulfurimonas sp.]|nr:hypothetical protein [Sulfurimonas sp.]
MKILIYGIMFFMFSNLAASTKTLKAEELSISYIDDNLNDEIYEDFKKVEFKVGIADSLKQLDDRYHQNIDIMSRFIVMLNYKF